MRLLQRTNRTYLLFTAALLMVSAIALYFIITRVITDEVSEKLTVDRERVVQALEAGHAVVELPPIIEIDTLPGNAREEPLEVGDVHLLDPIEGDEEPFREVRGSQVINGVHYRIAVRAVVLEPHDYLFSIGLALLLGSLLVLVGLWWVNRRMARTVWGSFHRNLEALQRFDLRKNDALALEASGITEFTELNAAVTLLTERIAVDHRALKEFTGNASHEMQTPLAVLQAQLEKVLSVPGLDEHTAIAIQEAHTQVLRMSRLHQGLLLMSRVENRQFKDVHRLNMALAVEAELERHADRLVAQGIPLEQELDRTIEVEAHPALLETLLANVIGNAIKHHRNAGPLRVRLTADRLEVSNPGDALTLAAVEYFQRFRKGDPTSASPGLGLSIAQSICEASGWRIGYEERGGVHTVTINF